MYNDIAWDRVLLTIEVSKWVYEKPDLAKPHFEQMGFTNRTYLDNDGAQGYLLSNNSVAVIAFRGTQPTHLEDIVADLNTIPKSHGPGFVHRGFRDYAEKLWVDVYAFALINPGKPIIVTGHSLGAAMATYIAQELEWHGVKGVELYTYGSPRLGSRDFVKAMTVPHWRFINNNDGVIYVPPLTFGFKHHGTPVYIDFYGTIRPMTLWQRIKDKLRGYLKAYSKLQFFDTFYDHSVDQYYTKIKKVLDNQEK